MIDALPASASGNVVPFDAHWHLWLGVRMIAIMLAFMAGMAAGFLVAMGAMAYAAAEVSWTTGTRKKSKDLT